LLFFPLLFSYGIFYAADNLQKLTLREHEDRLYRLSVDLLFSCKTKRRINIRRFVNFQLFRFRPLALLLTLVALTALTTARRRISAATTTALLTTRTTRTKFILRQFPIAILIQLLQCRRSIGNFRSIDDVIAVRIQRFDQRHGRTPFSALPSLASLTALATTACILPATKTRAISALSALLLRWPLALSEKQRSRQAEGQRCEEYFVHFHNVIALLE
jgi:hypothetical protein